MNSVGVALNSSSKGPLSSGKASNGTIKSNQANKSGPLASQVGAVLNPTTYAALPSFRDVPSSEKPNLFINKLRMHCVVFDFSDPYKNIKEKDIKHQTA